MTDRSPGIWSPQIHQNNGHRRRAGLRMTMEVCCRVFATNCRLCVPSDRF